MSDEPANHQASFTSHTQSESLGCCRRYDCLVRCVCSFTGLAGLLLFPGLACSLFADPCPQLLPDPANFELNIREDSGSSVPLGAACGGEPALGSRSLVALGMHRKTGRKRLPRPASSCEIGPLGDSTASVEIQTPVEVILKEIEVNSPILRDAGPVKLGFEISIAPQPQSTAVKKRFSASSATDPERASNVRYSITRFAISGIVRFATADMLAVTSASSRSTALQLESGSNFNPSCYCVQQTSMRKLP